MTEIVPYPSDPRYGITRDGRVFRIVRSRFGRQVPFELSRRPDKDGYLMAAATFKVHRMVAEAFIPNPLGLPHVAHNDGSRTNNCVENLRWDTPKGNHADKRKHGTLLFGEQHAGAKLTSIAVQEARARAARGESHVSIAKDMPVDRSVLSRAIRGATWNHA